MAKMVFEVLTDAGSKRSKAQRIQILQENESWALKDVLRGTFDSTVQWILPDGDPPYTPAEVHNHPTNLLREHKKFGYFAKGGPHRDTPKFKIERMYIGMLEGIHPEDARVVINMINKESPKNITREIVKEAFPGLLLD